MATTDQQRKANVRLGLILASIALLFGVGFMVKMIFFSR
jgi:hypothetical protein